MPRARKPAPGTLLLFPGAGASREQSTLVAVDRGVAPSWATVRADFDYRKEGRRAPDRPPKLLAAVRREIAAIEAAGPARIVVGGRSMGGRICSMVAAGADAEAPPASIVGVVAISYPLHPPGKPETLRVDHLSQLTVPCLFIHGRRDPFGSPEELERWTATIPGPVTHHWMSGGHDLRGGDPEVAATVAAWLAER